MVKRAREFSSSYWRSLLLLVFAVIIGATALMARQEPVQQTTPDYVSPPITPVLTRPALDAPGAPELEGEVRPTNPRRTYPRPGAENVPTEPPPPELDALLAQQDAAVRTSDRAVQVPLNFTAQGFSNVNPPDPSGAIGPLHYVQMINGNAGTRVTIYNKTTGAVVTGPFILSTLGSGGACATGGGDPVVLYDHLASRWLLAEFTPPAGGNHMCVYISQTSDPTGTYFRYDFTTPNFPDYLKFSVWPSGYFVTTNEGTPPIYALDRTQMLSGAAATFQRFTVPALAGFGFQALTPADTDGTAPPGGSPAYFARHRDDEVHNSGSANGSQDFLDIWELTPNFATPASSVLTGPTSIGVTSFDSTLCGLVSFNCFPQPASGVTLDPLREVIMYRLQYRNFGSHASMVGNFVVDTNGADRGGIRWFELRKTGGGAWTLYQEGTYSPDATNRWMGGIAMDASGNILLAYSVSSASVAPGLRFTGRVAGDALGTMTTAETVIVDGSAANSSNRWGDYHELTIDPTDDCTFWMTGMFSPASQWTTRIAKLKFDGCGGPFITGTGNTVAYGNYVPANSVIDPGERVSVNLTLANGGAPTSNLVGTLAATGGVTVPTGPVSYGAIATAGSTARQYRFTASGSCGSTLTASLQLQDGATSLGTVPFQFTLGTVSLYTPLNESFDGVTAPALPTGWSTAVSGAGGAWVTSTTSPSSGTNAAFAPNPASSGNSELVSPAFAVPNATTLVQFRNNYNTESTYDGMVLEISINGGAYSDITTGGNVFVSGGYNGTVSSCCSNPLAGRAAWTGDSLGYITSAINLPAAAQGQIVRLKWRMGTDSIVADTGVRIDTFSVVGSVATCNAVPQVFTDTVTAALTAVKGLHITELRGRIDAQRARFGLGGYAWTNPTLAPGTVLIQAAHIVQMRAALADVWAPAGLTPPVYTDPGLAAGTVVRAAHVNDIRNAVMAVENY